MLLFSHVFGTNKFASDLGGTPTLYRNGTSLDIFYVLVYP